MSKIIGLEILIRQFITLLESAHSPRSHLFFGDASVGKATAARIIAAFFETGKFDDRVPLLDTFIVECKEGTLGIDIARNIKTFLSEKPFFSKFRTVIIDDASRLTQEAQNALLKIVEEPPTMGLVIIVVSNDELINPTLRSRVMKWYFGRMKTEDIKQHLVLNLGVSVSLAESLASRAFGCIGRAVTGVNSVASQTSVGSIKNTGKMKKNVVSELESRIIDLYLKDKIKNSGKVSRLLHRQYLASLYNLNVELQLKSATIEIQ